MELARFKGGKQRRGQPVNCLACQCHSWGCGMLAGKEKKMRWFGQNSAVQVWQKGNGGKKEADWCVVQGTADREGSCVPDTQGGQKEPGGLNKKERSLGRSCQSGRGRRLPWISSGCLGWIWDVTGWIAQNDDKVKEWEWIAENGLVWADAWYIPKWTTATAMLLWEGFRLYWAHKKFLSCCNNKCTRDFAILITNAWVPASQYYRKNKIALTNGRNIGKLCLCVREWDGNL